MSLKKITVVVGSAPERATEEINSHGPVPSEEETTRRDCEAVELGIGSRTHLADSVRPVPGVQPHGLLAVPPEVETVIAREEDQLFEDTGLRLAAAAKWKLIVDQTLDWYFRDQWVSYRETPRGVDMLAVGPDEISRLMQSGLSQDDLLSIRTRQI